MSVSGLRYMEWYPFSGHKYKSSVVIDLNRERSHNFLYEVLRCAPETDALQTEPPTQSVHTGRITKHRTSSVSCGSTGIKCKSETIYKWNGNRAAAKKRSPGFSHRPRRQGREILVESVRDQV